MCCKALVCNVHLLLTWSTCVHDGEEVDANSNCIEDGKGFQSIRSRVGLWGKKTSVSLLMRLGQLQQEVIVWSNHRTASNLTLQLVIHTNSYES